MQSDCMRFHNSQLIDAHGLTPVVLRTYRNFATYYDFASPSLAGLRKIVAKLRGHIYFPPPRQSGAPGWHSSAAWRPRFSARNYKFRTDKIFDLAGNKIPSHIQMRLGIKFLPNILPTSVRICLHKQALLMISRKMRETPDLASELAATRLKTRRDCFKLSPLADRIPGKFF